MASYEIEQPDVMNPNVLEKLKARKLSLEDIDWKEFPWWFVALILVSGTTLIVVLSNPAYHEAFLFIIAGLGLTAIITLSAFFIAVVLGLATGLSRISEGVFAKNAATFYVELVRGVPMLVLMFFIAFVLVPGFVNVVNELGAALSNAGLSGVGRIFSALSIRDIPMTVRAVIALSLTYGAFLAGVPCWHPEH